MNGKGQRVQAADEGRSRGFEKLVAQPVNTRRASGTSSLPIAVSYYLSKRDTVARSAPGCNQNIRIHVGHFFGRNLLAGSTEKFAASDFHQFRNPGLRGNQELAPFLAENRGTRQSRGARANLFDCVLHVFDQMLAAIVRSDCSGDDGDIGIDVGKLSRSETEERNSALEYFDDRLFLVRDGGDDKIGPRRYDLIRIGSPGVGEDGMRLRFNFGNHISAIPRARDHAAQFADTGKNHSGARLQAGNASGGVSGRHLIQDFTLMRVNASERASRASCAA